MRTYSLVYSSDKYVLTRRLEKAALSRSERILGIGFSGPPPKASAQNSFVWAWQGSIHETRATGWDEYHFVMTEPTDLDLLTVGQRGWQYIIQPQKISDFKSWNQAIEKHQSILKNEKVFFEFEPWSKDFSQRFTVSEVAQFLYSMKHHFSFLEAKPRPGVATFDYRIPDYFELEAYQVETHDYQVQVAKPELSVIIPSYNSRHFLHLVLQHLGEQSIARSDFEVIVVDDGGTDDSWEYLQTFGLPLSLQLRYLYWPRPTARIRGDSFFRAGLCRNLGARNARGEIFVFLDSDMLVPRNFLETVKREIKTSNVLQFPRVHISQADSTPHFHLRDINNVHLFIEESHYWKPFFDSKNWMELRNFWKYTCTYGLALSKDSFFAAGCFHRTYVSYGFEDTELGYRLSKLGKTFKLVQLNLYHLTSYTSSEYQSSKYKRRKLLQRTAKQFFLNTLDLDVYEILRGMMGVERAFFNRIKKALFSQEKNKASGEDLSATDGSLSTGEDTISSWLK